MSGEPDFVATVSREEWLAVYDKLRPYIGKVRHTLHFGGPLLRPPNAGPRWKPEGYTVWIGDKYATAKTIGVAVDRAIRKYENEEPDAEQSESGRGVAIHDLRSAGSGRDPADRQGGSEEGLF